MMIWNGSGYNGIEPKGTRQDRKGWRLKSDRIERDGAEPGGDGYDRLGRTQTVRHARDGMGQGGMRLDGSDRLVGSG